MNYSLWCWIKFCDRFIKRDICFGVGLSLIKSCATPREMVDHFDRNQNNQWTTEDLWKYKMCFLLFKMKHNVLRCLSFRSLEGLRIFTFTQKILCIFQIRMGLVWMASFYVDPCVHWSLHFVVWSALLQLCEEIFTDIILCVAVRFHPVSDIAGR